MTHVFILKDTLGFLRVFMPPPVAGAGVMFRHRLSVRAFVRRAYRNSRYNGT